MFYVSDVLQRVSFLRDNLEFQKAALSFKGSKSLVYFNGKCLKDIENANELYFGDINNVEYLKIAFEKYYQLLDTNPIDINTTKLNFNLVFLGLINNNCDTTTFQYKEYKGTPLFAIEFNEDANNIENSLISNPNDTFLLNIQHSSLYAQSNTILRWQANTKFCSLCSSSIYFTNLGNKLLCSNKDCKYNNNKRPQSFQFPRTDPIVITGITNLDYSKLLLVRSKSYIRAEANIPGKRKLYSIVAGFIEVGESLQNAAIREAYEETGVIADMDNVDILNMTQPWPFPSNLMFGCITKIHFNGKNELINLYHDPELADARWVNTIDLVNAFKKSETTTKTDFPLIFLNDEIAIPGDTTIACHIMNTIAHRYEKSTPRL